MNTIILDMYMLAKLVNVSKQTAAAVLAEFENQRGENEAIRAAFALADQLREERAKSERH